MSKQYQSRQPESRHQANKEASFTYTEHSSQIENILYLQRTIGNQATMQLLRERQTPLIQRIDSESSEEDDDLILKLDENGNPIDTTLNLDENTDTSEESDDDSISDFDEDDELENDVITNEHLNDNTDDRTQEEIQADFETRIQEELVLVQEARNMLELLKEYLKEGNYQDAVPIFAHLTARFDLVVKPPNFQEIIALTLGSVVSGHGSLSSKYKGLMLEIVTVSSELGNELHSIAKQYFSTPLMYQEVSVYFEKRARLKAEHKQTVREKRDLQKRIEKSKRAQNKRTLKRIKHDPAKYFVNSAKKKQYRKKVKKKQKKQENLPKREYY